MLRKLTSLILIIIILFYNFLITFADENELIIENDLQNQEKQTENNNNTGSGNIDDFIDSEINSEGEQSTDTGSILLELVTNNLEIPDIIITFQSPSYLTDKSAIQETYHCDISKTECKVNFDLSDTFGGYVPAKFACLNNFSFTTGEENKCNPNTIIFSTGTYSINFKIYEKDNPDNFKEKSITIANEKELEQTETSSGSSKGTGSSIEELVPNQDTNSGSLNQETSTGTISESGSIDSLNGSNLIEIPNVDIEIQSGLELLNGVYKCKDTACKINLNLENLFTGTYDKNNYFCEWDFGSGTFTTIDTDKKCNPGYVNYGTGNYTITAKIYEKNNILNFKIGNLSFNNGVSNYFYHPGTSSGGQSSSSGGQNSNTGSFEESGSGYIDLINDSETSPEGQANTGTDSSAEELLPSNLEIPNVDIEIQSGLELLNGVYKCKDIECKVNLNLENIFTGTYDKNNYSCEWGFGSGTFTTIDTDKKCNPGYINYGTGNHTIIAKIYEKDNLNNFKTGSLSFGNDTNSIIIDPDPEVGTEGVSISVKSDTSSQGGITQIIKNIIMQSGANEIGENAYECNEEKCKINIQYKNSSNETCLWNFAGGIYKETYTTTCNPSFVYYYSGSHKIKLTIYKSGVFSEEKNMTLKNNFLGKAQESNLPPTAKIKLQGKLSQNKTLIGNKLICKNTKECSVNFDGSESNDLNLEKLNYYWDFGNGNFEEKANPKTVKYSPGKYKINLKVVDRFGETSEDYFLVEVYEKEQEIVEINDNITKYIKIIEALPNPIGSEEGEWIKIKNDSINFVNIKGLEIDDKIGKGSKSYIIKNDFYLLPYQEKKLYKGETKLNLNNSFDEINLIYNSTIIDKLVWNYEVPEGFVVKKELKEKVKVINVIDGDTILIQFKDDTKEKLRLIGVDTPETKHPKKEVQFYGKEASNFTKEYLEGKEIELELDADNYRDKYGRLLGYVWVDNINLNKLLIQKGYGRAYLYFPFKYSAEFAKAENEAKKLKLGIWGDDEVKKEMQLLEKIDKLVELENIEMPENLSFTNFIGNVTSFVEINAIKENLFNKTLFVFLYRSKIDDKTILQDFDTLLSELIEPEKNTIKIVEKQEKIITYKTSKLKSGLKITGKTFPNSLITLTFDDAKLETKSNEIGNYSFLITENLKVGDYSLQFLVSNGGQDYFYLAPRSLTLSKDYIFGVQDYKVKQANKKVKVKKSKKTKKKKKVLAQNTTKKMKYDVKDIKKEIDKSTPKNIILIFLISLLISIMGFFVIRKVD